MYSNSRKKFIEKSVISIKHYLMQYVKSNYSTHTSVLKYEFLSNIHMNWKYILGYFVTFKTLPFPTNNISSGPFSFLFCLKLASDLISHHSHCFSDSTKTCWHEACLRYLKDLFHLLSKEKFPSPGHHKQYHDYLGPYWRGWGWAGQWLCSRAETDATLLPYISTTKGNRWDNPENLPNFGMKMSSKA